MVLKHLTMDSKMLQPFKEKPTLECYYIGVCMKQVLDHVGETSSDLMMVLCQFSMETLFSLFFLLGVLSQIRFNVP